MSKNELVTRQAGPGSSVPGVPERATRVASWIGWHLFEITGVTVPAVVAVTVTSWWWLVSGVVGAGWTANEVRAARKRATIQAGRGVPATVEPSVTVSDETSGVDDERVGGVR